MNMECWYEKESVINMYYNKLKNRSNNGVLEINIKRQDLEFLDTRESSSLPILRY